MRRLEESSAHSLQLESNDENSRTDNIVKIVDTSGTSVLSRLAVNLDESNNNIALGVLATNHVSLTMDVLTVCYFLAGKLSSSEGSKAFTEILKKNMMEIGDFGKLTKAENNSKVVLYKRYACVT